jgi:hypothetical protein
MRYCIKVPDENGQLYFPNKKLSLSKSNHFVLGYSKAIRKDLRFLVEAYYQHLYNVPVSPDTLYTYSSINDEAIYQPLVNEGTGRNYGIEFTLEKFFTDKYYFLLTHSLYNAKYKPLDGRWYNSEYNNNYITNLTGGREFRIRDRNILQLNGRLLWSGGKRGDSFDWDWVDDEDFIYKSEKHSNDKRYKDYLRLDIGAKYKINKPRVTHEIGFDIQNVTNRWNIAYVSYFIDDEGQNYTSYSYMQGILPFFHYKLEF